MNVSRTSSIRSLMLALIGIVIGGCDGTDKERNVTLETTEYNQDTMSKQEHPASNNIAWFDGSIEQAFTHAKTANKPLFLYWGAVWCPPCEEIKQTVFQSPNFIAQSRLFVPVYLDGDTERAQSWGEQYVVKGYPTMIIFNPAGEEITRLPGAIDIERYNDVLRLSLNGMKNTSTLINKALNSSTQLSNDDYTQIAFYSWDQENLELNRPVTAEMLETLSHNAAAQGNDLAASRLLFQALITRHVDEQPLSSLQAKETQEHLLKILRDPQLVIANLDFSLFWSEEITRLVTPPNESRDQLAAQWTESMQTIRHLPTLSKAEQLGSWYPEVYLYWLTHPAATTLPATMEQGIRTDIAALDKNTQGSARQTVINKAYQVLQAAHLYEESRSMLLAEIEKSQSPYYFMSGLASLEEKLGNNTEAVDWLKQAYDSSTGNATRFQWGVEYVTGTIRIQPDARERIAAATNGLLDNLEQPDDVFSGRNYGRLQTLLASLNEWENQQAVSELQPFFQALKRGCDATAPDSLARANCEAIILK